MQAVIMLNYKQYVKEKAYDKKVMGKSLKEF